MLALTLPPAPGVSAEQPVASAFGNSEKKESSLIGIFYDLKQNQQRVQLAGSGKSYAETLDRFFATGLDEAVLNNYFRATRALYADRIWMPRMSADEAPRAFGVGDVVAPSRWIAQYKGQISAPAAGTYRFLGRSDDVLVVALGGKVVLNANHPGTKMPMTAWTPKESPPKMTGGIVAGDWFTVGQDEILDLDVVVGENPGGSFLAHLYIQQRVTPHDPTSAEGIGPFRLSEEPTPGIKNIQDVPAWKAIQ